MTSGHALKCLQHLRSYIPAVHTLTVARALQQGIFVLIIKLHTDLPLKAERVMAPQVNTTVLFQEQDLPARKTQLVCSSTCNNWKFTLVMLGAADDSSCDTI